MSTADSKPEDPARCSGAGCPRSACLQLFIDGELDPTPASDVEAHLAACAACAERASLLVATKVSLRRTCTTRAPDALRARLCLAVARESAVLQEGVEADFGAQGSSPSRESLVADRFAADRVADRATEKAERSTRVAYGVGALALAAGVALAVVGERVSATTAGLGSAEGASSEQPPIEGAEALSPETAARGRVGDAAGVGVPGGLLPGPGRDGIGGARVAAVPGAPSLAPSSLTAHRDERPTFDSILDDLVAEHMNPLPPEETNPAKLRRFDSVVGVAMRPPTLRKYHAHFRGARVLPMRGAQRTAMLQYELPDGERITVYLWNPQAVPLGTTRLHPRILHDARDGALASGSGGRQADAAPIYVGEARGYSIAACERRGVGYALATKRDADESARMVAASLP